MREHCCRITDPSPCDITGNERRDLNFAGVYRNYCAEPGPGDPHALTKIIYAI